MFRRRSDGTKHIGIELGILTRGDPERYLETHGIGTCTAIALYFPRSKVIVLDHILPTTSLDTAIAEISRNLAGTIKEPPFYHLELGSAAHPNFWNPGTEKRDPEVLQKYFTGARPSNRVTYGEMGTFTSVRLDKKSGAISVYKSF